jgi:hypothetical protein
VERVALSPGLAEAAGRWCGQDVSEVDRMLTLITD